MGFVNFGRGNEGARDGFVYASSHDGPQADTPADQFILMRAPQDRLTNRVAWAFSGDDAFSVRQARFNLSPEFGPSKKDERRSER